MKCKFSELEAILDIAITEIGNGHISPDDGDKILIALCEDYRRLGNIPPDVDIIKTYINKYVKK